MITKNFLHERDKSLFFYTEKNQFLKSGTSDHEIRNYKQSIHVAWNVTMEFEHLVFGSKFHEHLFPILGTHFSPCSSRRCRSFGKAVLVTLRNENANCPTVWITR